MANGYDPGDYLGKFLTQLPQMYQANKNAQLQRERFEYFKEEGAEDRAYKTEVVASAKEKNELAREIFDEKLRQAKLVEDRQGELKAREEIVNAREDYNFIKLELIDYPEAKKNLLLSTPFIKKNPEYGVRIDATFKASTDLDDRIYAAAAMPPGPRLEEYRKIRLDKNLNKTQIGYIDTAITGAREEATVTSAEYQAQPSYRLLEEAETAYRNLVKEGRRTDPMNPGKYLETPEQYEGRLKQGFDRIEFFDKEVRAQEAAGRGKYIPMEDFPDSIEYNNVEDTVDDKQVDEALSVLGSPPIESAILPPEFAPPEKPSTPPQMYTEDSLGVPQDIEAVPPEEAEAFLPARDYSPASSEDMKKYGNQVFFDKDTSQWYDLQTMEPATISQIKKHQGKDKPKGLSKYQKNNINRALKQIAQLKTKTFDKDTLEGKINRLKKKILNIDSNYKFKN